MRPGCTISCPALINARVQRNVAGQFELNLKTPSGATALRTWSWHRWSSGSDRLHFFHSQLCGCVFDPVNVAEGST
jgi:hypothetical protein